MVDRKMYQRIQNLKKQGYGKLEIGRKLKLDPATVRKYYSMYANDYLKYQKETLHREKVFDDFKEEILSIYEINNYNRLNMNGVYDYLEEKFITLPGGEKSLRNYIHFLESEGDLEYQNKIRLYTKVPELAYGKQMQLDFGEKTTQSGLKLYIFAVVLSASRYKYITFQDTPFKTLDVIHHLLDTFDFFEGYAVELVIDQDSLMVTCENYGEIIYTKKFKAFINEMGIKMYVCRKADPETKGKIENVIKYVKYNFLSVRDFETLEEANDSVKKWLDRRANGKISQATKKVPSIAMEEEKMYLKPVKNSIYRKNTYLGREIRTVSDKSFIMVKGIEYSAPVEYRLRRVEFYQTTNELYIFDSKTGKEIASHSIPKGTVKKVFNRGHFRHKSLEIKELEEKVISLFDDETWNGYVKTVRKELSRFSRDQFIFALDHFSSLEEPELFRNALIYCSKDNAIGMKVLYDTYKYYLKEHKEDQSVIVNAFNNIGGLYNIPEIRVPKRSVTKYEDIIQNESKGAAV